MIVSHMIGGLGNQMFQYAFGKSRAMALNVDLRLHTTDFDQYHCHQGFELQRVFDSSFQVISDQEFRHLLGWRSNRYCRKVIQHHYFSFLRNSQFIVEPSFEFWSGASSVKDDSFLVGYWQSEKYFLDIQETIRKDFSFKQKLSRKNSEIIAKMKTCNAVSIHVRRGDYVENPATTQVHGLCPLDYYRRAINYLSKHVSQPVFFVFSDDIAWVRENLILSFPCHYVDHNQGAESYNDMRLMSLCNHHIIANSSFSWWGAWLNPDPEKIVVAPTQWFANKNSIKDLILPSWLTL